MAGTTTNLGLNRFDGGDLVDVSLITANFDTIDQLGIDYITEQGTDAVNGWTYRKWKSGIKECFGHFTKSSIAAGAYATFDVSLSAIGFSSVSTACVTASGSFDGEPSVGVAYTRVESSKAKVYLKNTSSSTKNAQCNIHVIGR